MRDFPEKVTMCGNFAASLTSEEMNRWHEVMRNDSDFRAFVILKSQLKQAEFDPNASYETFEEIYDAIFSVEEILFNKSAAFVGQIENERREARENTRSVSPVRE